MADTPRVRLAPIDTTVADRVRHELRSPQYGHPATVEVVPQPGPIFIHKDPCGAFDGDDIPPDFRALPLFLEAFGRGTWLVRREPVDAGSMEADIAALLRDPRSSRC